MTTADEELATLTRWAGGLGRADQDRLLLALANVLASEPLGSRSRRLFEALLPTLAEGADLETRRELAARLVQAPWAPDALLEQLAAEDDPGLQLLVARSPALSSAAADLLIEHGAPEVLLALVSNSARLGPESLGRLVEASRRQAALRAPLSRRPDLDSDQAARLAAWSSPPLRRELARRFGLTEVARPPEREAETARRVVEKVGRSGRLTPAYAFTALRQGRLRVFQQALATLGGVPADAVLEASQADDPAPLALACAATGVDRAIFPDILREVRALNGGRPGETPAAAQVIAAFQRRPSDAAEALRSAHARRTARWAGA